MAADSNRAATWVMSTLRADSALATVLGATDATKRIYRRKAPRNIGVPYIVVAAVSALPRIGAIMTGPDTHTATPVRVQCSVWDKNNFDTIDAAVARMDTVLDGLSDVTASGVFVEECIRDGEIEREMHEGDIDLYGYDIFYRVTAKAT